MVSPAVKHYQAAKQSSEIVTKRRLGEFAGRCGQFIQELARLVYVRRQRDVESSTVEGF
jgi:hypothetical protein